jgi:hypothetical protein
MINVHLEIQKITVASADSRSKAKVRIGCHTCTFNMFNYIQDSLFIELLRVLIPVSVHMGIKS